MEGLFRVPGPAQHIEDLRKDFEEGRYNHKRSQICHVKLYL